MPLAIAPSTTPRSSCNALQHAATYCNLLQQTAKNCNALHRTAPTLQRTAPLCSALQHGDECTCLQTCMLVVTTHYNTLKHYTTCYNTLQHAATRFNIHRPVCSSQNSNYHVGPSSARRLILPSQARASWAGVCCSVLQRVFLVCVAVWEVTLLFRDRASGAGRCVAIWCCVLQRVAVCVSQCVAARF